MYKMIYIDELYHHGIKGQKWGIRRYQNYDGTKKVIIKLLKRKVHMILVMILKKQQS